MRKTTKLTHVAQSTNGRTSSSAGKTLIKSSAISVSEETITNVTDLVYYRSDCGWCTAVCD
jgi:hypothetical protein